MIAPTQDEDSTPYDVDDEENVIVPQHNGEI
jgi:hypothetical protein